MDNTDTLLMCRDTPVLRFNLYNSSCEVLDKKLLPYQLKGTFYEQIDMSDLSKAVQQVNHNSNVIQSFLARRVLNLTRTNAKKILNAYNLSQEDDVSIKCRIALICHGVSMSDSYWIKSINDKRLWKDTNIRKVSLSKVVENIALNGEVLTATGSPGNNSSELFTKGVYAKAWQRGDDGFCYLRKRGLNNSETQPKAEVEASNILNHTNIPHAVYQLVKDELGYMSRCQCVATDDLGMVDASELKLRFNRYNTQFKNFTEYALSKDRKNILLMCLADYLTGNSDRHIDNWGFYHDYTTGELNTLYPAIDFNHAFDSNVLANSDGGRCQPLYDLEISQLEAAQLAIEEYGSPFHSDVTPEDFYYDAHYEAFKERLSNLNI